MNVKRSERSEKPADRAGEAGPRDAGVLAAGWTCANNLADARRDPGLPPCTTAEYGALVACGAGAAPASAERYTP
jgi:hypothetical protein